MNRRSLCLSALLPALAACASLNRDPSAEPARVVFFTGESDRLDAPARAVVREAAEAAQRLAPVPLQVLAYGGPAGGADFNRALAEARAQHVAELLRQAGLPADRMSVTRRPPAPAMMAPIESRRVEIRLAAP